MVLLYMYILLIINATLVLHHQVRRLRLGDNYLSGPLPPIGAGGINRRLRFLSVRNNALKGSIPSELLLLSNLG